MNTAIATTLISVLGAGLFAGLYGMLFHHLRDVSTRLASLNSSIRNMDTKFTAQLQDHGDRLARIEAKLDIDPPAEAAHVGASEANRCYRLSFTPSTTAKAASTPNCAIDL